MDRQAEYVSVERLYITRVPFGLHMKRRFHQPSYGHAHQSVGFLSHKSRGAHVRDGSYLLEKKLIVGFLLFLDNKICLQ